MSEASIQFNQNLALAISDVDETMADVYTPAEPIMITELDSFLADGHKVLMASGGSKARMQRDITDRVAPELRHNILICHCSGTEVWGFTEAGELRDQPFYSVYEEAFTSAMKLDWRSSIDQLVTEFNFVPHPAQQKSLFAGKYGDNPLDIMLDDRGPQITLQLINAYDLSDTQMARVGIDVPYTNGQRDLRMLVKQRAEELFQQAGLPVTPRIAGSTSIDIAMEGVSKTTAIQYVLGNASVLATIGLTLQDVSDMSRLEIWGDRFSAIRGGTDRHMCEALPEVRAIDFRPEDPAELQGYNIVMWDGERHLHHGLAEYLQSRH